MPWTTMQLPPNPQVGDRRLSKMHGSSYSSSGPIRIVVMTFLSLDTAGQQNEIAPAIRRTNLLLCSTTSSDVIVSAVTRDVVDQWRHLQQTVTWSRSGDWWDDCKKIQLKLLSETSIGLDSLYTFTGNDVTIYFRSAANRINVFSLGHVRVVISR